MSEANKRAGEVISSWSALYEARNLLLAQYRRVWDVPLADSNLQVLAEELRPGSRVLDIGSSDRSLERLLAERVPCLVYRSMDVDRRTRQDYYSLDDIHETFDAAVLFEVIEHLTFEQGVRLLARACDLVVPGGKLILSTPNVAHPTHFYRDPTHLTPYSHEGIGGVLIALGYRLDRMCRIYDAPVFRKALRLLAASPIHRYFGTDFAHTLVVVASRPS